MARMIPEDVPDEDFNGSFGEKRVFDALQLLPKEYIVFHSVHWQKRNSQGVKWGEADFTIFHPKRGLIVIEVKSGGIRHDEKKKWIQINSLTKEEYKMKDPLIQAGRSKYTFVDIIEPIQDNVNKYWVDVAVWFPSIENKNTIGKLPPSYTSEIVLLQDDLSSPLRSIERIFDYYGMYEQSVYCQDDVKWVVNALSPKFDAIPSLSYDISEQSFAFNRMTQEQGALLDYLDEQRVAAIQGGAGTGKTMLAIEKAKRLAISDKVLFLCFNKFLLSFLKATYSSQNPNIEFYNLQALACTKTGHQDASENEGITSYLNSFDSYSWEYKHIIIDEGQDFLVEHVKILSAIAEIQNGCFYVFYDRNQLVQQRQQLEWVDSMDCRLVLTTNCRNTKSIAITSYRPIGIEHIKMKLDVMGSKPNLFITNSINQACDRICKLIRQYTDNGMAKRDIVILTVKTEETSILNAISSIGPYHLSNEYGSPGILFTSSRKFKGLESAVIIMVDMDDTIFLREEARRVLYVGSSRARHFLDIVSVLSDTQLDTIGEFLTGQKSKNAKLMIGSQLKVKITVD